MMRRRDWAILASLVGLFLGIYLLPIGSPAVESAVGEGLRLTRWYAREHVILCLLPAFLIAGAIAAFVDKAAIIRHLGPSAKKPTAYAVGSTSGCILAVCSCTVLPLFAGIYRMGAGVGPAVAFLYAGPAINVLAVILTARVLGLELGLARAVGAVIFSVLIGLAMSAVFERRRSSDEEEARPVMVAPDAADARPLHHLIVLFALMVAVLIFANWAGSPDAVGFWRLMHEEKWLLTTGAALPLAIVLWRWFAFPARPMIAAGAVVAGLSLLTPERPSIPFAAAIVALCLIMPLAGGAGREWWAQTWHYTKLITPLLLAGVFAAGLLLGTPESRGLVPPEWVERTVGGDGVLATLGASVVGAFMYFATLTEVPILEGLMASGMGKGPALALLLAGPALSLPNMLVIHGVMGLRRTAAYVAIVIVGSTLAGLIYASIF